MGDGRNDEPAIVFEADKTTVKEMVNARRQEQSILAIQSFFIGGVPPWLAMAGD